MPQAADLHDEESDHTGWLTREPASMPTLALAAAVGAWLGWQRPGGYGIGNAWGEKRSKIDTGGEVGRRSDGLRSY